MGILSDLFADTNPVAEEASQAWGLLNEKIGQDESATQEKAWLENRKPGERGMRYPGDANVPNPTNNLQRWKKQIDAMVNSGNPTMVKEGLSMLQAYQQRANPASIRPTDKRSTAGKQAEDMGFAPGTKPYRDMVNKIVFKEKADAMSQYGKMAEEMGFTRGTPEFQAKVEELYKNKGRAYAPRRVTKPESEVMQWKDPEKRGKELLVGKSWEDVQEAIEPKLSESAAGARQILEFFEENLYDPEKGILNDDIYQDSGLSGTIKATLGGAYNVLTQEDPRYLTIKSFAEGTAAPIVRTLGEKGNLSDTDIKRALALLPKIGSIGQIGDTKAVIDLKMKYLRQLLGATGDGDELGSNLTDVLSAGEARIKSQIEKEKKKAGGSDETPAGFSEVGG